LASRSPFSLPQSTGAAASPVASRCPENTGTLRPDAAPEGPGARLSGLSMAGMGIRAKANRELADFEGGKSAASAARPVPNESLRQFAAVGGRREEVHRRSRDEADIARAGIRGFGEETGRPGVGPGKPGTQKGLDFLPRVVRLESSLRKARGGGGNIGKAVREQGEAVRGRPEAVLEQGEAVRGIREVARGQRGRWYHTPWTDSLTALPGFPMRAEERGGFSRLNQWSRANKGILPARESARGRAVGGPSRPQRRCGLSAPAPLRFRPLRGSRRT
jgi:hypothetical protein